MHGLPNSGRRPSLRGCRLPLLAYIAQVAPLFGLLGTVLGMVDLFSSMQVAGDAVSTTTLSAGIWKALLTTAAGLMIAIPTIGPTGGWPVSWSSSSSGSSAVSGPSWRGSRVTFRLPQRARLPITLNLSPLIDVIFILLIFVVLVARFVEQERIDVNLPSAAAERPAELDALEITVTAGGVVAIEGEVIGPDHLCRARGRYRRAVLLADEGVGA